MPPSEPGPPFRSTVVPPQGPLDRPARHRSRRWRVALGVGVAVVLATAVLVARQVTTATVVGNGFAVRCLAIGAAVPGTGLSGRASLPLFVRAEQALGPLTMRRSFDNTLPANFADSAAGGDDAAGLRSFTSWKPPHGDHSGAAEGRYDRQISAWAKSVPRTGVYATAFHEPENDMSAADYVAFERHVYAVVKAANPTIRFGPVDMAYWWDPTQPKHYIGSPSAWWPGRKYADFVGLDWYGSDPKPMTTSPSFRNWYRFASRTGLPLAVPEYGQYSRLLGQPPDPAKEQARVRAIHQDADFLFHHAEFTLWLYWQGGDAVREYRMKDSPSRAEWSRIARSGCRP